MAPPYEKTTLSNDFRDDAGADRLAALANRKAQPLLHRDRRNQLHRDLDVVPGITISVPAGSSTAPVTSVVRK